MTHERSKSVRASDLCGRARTPQKKKKKKRKKKLKREDTWQCWVSLGGRGLPDRAEIFLGPCRANVMADARSGCRSDVRVRGYDPLKSAFFRPIAGDPYNSWRLSTRTGICSYRCFCRISVFGFLKPGWTFPVNFADIRSVILKGGCSLKNQVTQTVINNKSSDLVVKGMLCKYWNWCVNIP